MNDQNVAALMVKCLEEEGVEYIFGIPGEENTDFMQALSQSKKIRFILTRHEQGASFMADIYGRLTNKPGVCLATLGPGAINLLLGTADAQLDGSPLVALAAQASMDRLHKESHQVIDLERLFAPVTKWSNLIALPDTANESIRKAFKLAQSGRKGAVALILPEDIAKDKTLAKPLKVQFPPTSSPNLQQVDKAAKAINAAKNVILLAGSKVYQEHAEVNLSNFVTTTKIQAATTFMGKGVIPADNEYCLGAVGFMRHDYINFGFDEADLVITVGYDLIEYAPKAWNPKGNKKIIHIHTQPAEVDDHYQLTVGIEGDINETLQLLGKKLKPRAEISQSSRDIQNLLFKELNDHDNDQSFPLSPQRIVGDIRKAMGHDDIVLCDTGALKMWMARLYPCYHPNTCIISNSLATMGFTLPGALAAKLVNPKKKVLAAMGDGSFMMNSQEIETAKREKLPLVILIWRDSAYGLIKWKQELEYGESHFIEFSNPDFVAYAESFGIKGYSIKRADELLPTLEKALQSDELVLIDCPVDYSENEKLTQKLGSLTDSI